MALHCATENTMTGTPAVASDSTVHTVSIGGYTIVIECRADGVVLVNGDVVEPAQITLERFRAEGQQP